MLAKLLPLLSAFAILAGTACTAGLAQEGDKAGPTPTHMPSPSSGETTLVPAPIEDVEVVVAESHPPQVFLRVVSGLPNGCARVQRGRVSRQGNTIRVEILNAMPAGKDVVCTMIYGMEEQRIPLGSDFIPGQTYTIEVNDVSEIFVAN